MKENKGDFRQNAEALFCKSPDNIDILDTEQAQQLFQDLQIHQIELELQNEELRSTQHELETARMRYSTLYHNAPVGYVILDGTGIIRKANATFIKLVKNGSDVLPGQPFAKFIHNIDEPVFRARYKSFFRNPSGKTMELRLRDTDNHSFYARLEAAPHKDDRSLDDHDSLLMTVSDISEQKEAEATIAHHNRVLFAIRKVHQLIIHEKDRDRLLSGACRMLTETQGFRNAWIALLDESGHVEKTVISLSHERDGIDANFFSKQMLPCLEHALKASDLAVMQDFDPRCRPCPIYDTCAKSAEFTRKLIHDDKIYGVLSVSIPAVHLSNQESRTLFKEVADDLAFALHKIDADEQLRRLNHIVTTTSQPMALVSPDYRYLAVNDVYAGLYARAKPDIIGLSMATVMGEPFFTTNMAPHLRRCLSGSKVQFAVEITLPTKQQRWFEHALTPYKNERGEIVGAVIHGFDITARKEMEQVLRISEHQKNLILNSTAELVAFYDSDMRLLWCNQAAERYASKTTDELVGASCYAVWHQRKEPCLGCPIREAARTKEPCSGDLNTPNGRHWYIRGYPILDDNDRLIGLVEFVQDTTDQKKAEAENERLLAAIEQAAEAFVITDTNGTIQYTNPAFETITGHARDDVLGKNPRLLKSGKHNEAFYKEMWETLLKGDVWSGHVVNKKKNGTLYTEETVISPLRSPTGETTNYVAVKRDITKELRMESKLRQAEKMEAIGHLAGGIAHDFNNVLAGIIGYADMVIDTLEEGNEIKRDIEQILKAADRAKHLVSQILAFSRQGPEIKKVIEVSPIITEAVNLLRATLPSSIAIHCEISNNLRPIQGDPTRIHEILMNLGTNAAHSIGEKGTITIRSDVIFLTDPLEGRLGDSDPGRYVRIDFSDTGKGMSPITLQHIFEPFYSEKGRGKGTGMGLAVVFGIVQSHKGNILVDSAVGRGATFSIFLPTVDTPSVLDHPYYANIQSGQERILFVDDEAMLRDLFHGILTSLGYKVTSFTDSTKALHHFETHPNDFDLVITDQSMPNLTGIELSKKILNSRKDLPIILCTGYSEFADEPAVKRAGIREFCLKPLRKKEMAETIRRVLDKSKA